MRDRLDLVDPVRAETNEHTLLAVQRDAEAGAALIAPAAVEDELPTVERLTFEAASRIVQEDRDRDLAGLHPVRRHRICAVAIPMGHEEIAFLVNVELRLLPSRQADREVLLQRRQDRAKLVFYERHGCGGHSGHAGSPLGLIEYDTGLSGRPEHRGGPGCRCHLAANLPTGRRAQKASAHEQSELAENGEVQHR